MLPLRLAPKDLRRIEERSLRESFIAKKFSLKASERFVPIIYISLAFAIWRYRSFSVCWFLSSSGNRVSRQRSSTTIAISRLSIANRVAYRRRSCSNNFDQKGEKKRHDLCDRRAASLETDIFIAISRDRPHRTRFWFISQETRIFFTLSAFDINDWSSRRISIGCIGDGISRVISPSRVSRKHRRSIFVIGESTNNRTRHLCRSIERSCRLFGSINLRCFDGTRTHLESNLISITTM